MDGCLDGESKREVKGQAVEGNGSVFPRVRDGGLFGWTPERSAACPRRVEPCIRTPDDFPGSLVGRSTQDASAVPWGARCLVLAENGTPDCCLGAIECPRAPSGALRAALIRRSHIMRSSIKTLAVGALTAGALIAAPAAFAADTVSQTVTPGLRSASVIRHCSEWRRCFPHGFSWDWLVVPECGRPHR